jgi:DNA adenine methylase
MIYESASQSSAFKVDAEFQNLLPSAPKFNDDQLEALIEADGGVKKPLIVWLTENGDHVLIDGHRRVNAVAALRKRGVEIADPAVEVKRFRTKLEALLYVIQNQDAARPNWNDDARALHILRNATLRAEIEAENRERMLKGKKSDDKAAKKGGTLAALAKAADVSRGKMHQWDAILRADKERGTGWVEKIIAKEATANEAYQRIRDFERDVLAQQALAMPLPQQPQDGHALDTVLVADADEGLKRVEPNSVALTVTSPPYPHGSLTYPHKGYSGYESWLKEMRAVFAEVYRVTKDGGRLAINIDNVTVPRDEDAAKLRRNSAFDLYQLLIEMGWVYRDTIIWAKGHAPATHPLVGSRGSPKTPRFQKTWEEILIFHKGSRELDGDQFTIKTKEFDQWTGNGLWIIQPDTTPRGGHPYTFPEEIPLRLIHLLTYRGDVVLDPFSGSGTTVKVAAQLHRRWIGIDSNPEYVRYALARVAAALPPKDGAAVPQNETATTAPAETDAAPEVATTPLFKVEQGGVADAAPRRIRTPLSWYGGKTPMLKELLAFLPPHQTYVELFGGSGALLFAKPPSEVEVYNDLYKDVVEFFRVLRDQPEELKRKLVLTPFSREEHRRAAEAYQQTVDPVERARLFYVLVMQSYGSIFGDSWGFGVKRDRSRPLARKADDLLLVAERLRTVEIENDSFEQVVRRYDSEDTVFFADPPYVARTRTHPKVYRHEMTDDQHRLMLETLTATKGKVILTGYAHPLYDSVLSGWERHVVRKPSPISKRGTLRDQIVWIKGFSNAARMAA